MFRDEEEGESSLSTDGGGQTARRNNVNSGPSHSEVGHSKISDRLLRVSSLM